MYMRQIKLEAPVLSDFERRAEFSFSTRSVCAHFGRLLAKKKIDGKGAYGVLIEFVERVKFDRPILVEKIYKIERKDEVFDYFNLDLNEKKKFVLRLIMDGISDVSQEFDVDFEACMSIAKEIEGSGYVNSWVWRKGKTVSPSGSLTAAIRVLHEVDFCEFQLVVYNKKKEIVHDQKIACFDKPDELIFMPCLGHIEWESESRVILHPAIPSKKPISIDVCY